MFCHRISAISAALNETSQRLIIIQYAHVQMIAGVPTHKWELWDLMADYYQNLTNVALSYQREIVLYKQVVG